MGLDVTVSLAIVLPTEELLKVIDKEKLDELVDECVITPFDYFEDDSLEDGYGYNYHGISIVETNATRGNPTFIDETNLVGEIDNAKKKFTELTSLPGKLYLVGDVDY